MGHQSPVLLRKFIDEGKEKKKKKRNKFGENEEHLIGSSIWSRN